ncbi:hypothetical protein ACFVY0_45610 [Streptomyces sp. NPDC058286]|uniref:hypothetical protein n=1 Tax=Streptomyces sp. NPDC058286 TaxID=3346422 RepID=UPI0036EECCEE
MVSLAGRRHRAFYDGQAFYDSHQDRLATPPELIAAGAPSAEPARPTSGRQFHARPQGRMRAPVRQSVADSTSPEVLTRGTPEERAEDLLSRMTLEEKAGLLFQPATAMDPLYRYGHGLLTYEG